MSLANKDLEPELECFDAQTHKAEGFGELKGGLVVKCSLGMARKSVSFLYIFQILLSVIDNSPQALRSESLFTSIAWIQVVIEYKVRSSHRCQRASLVQYSIR